MGAPCAETHPVGQGASSGPGRARAPLGLPGAWRALRGWAGHPGGLPGSQSRGAGRLRGSSGTGVMGGWWYRGDGGWWCSRDAMGDGLGEAGHSAQGAIRWPVTACRLCVSACETWAWARRCRTEMRAVRRPGGAGRARGPDPSSKSTLWVKAQHEGALPPPCFVRKDPRVPHTARRGA